MLGHDARKGLLVHFLNAVLQPEPDRRVQEIEILNPFNEREFESDKLSVVDVKARDVQNDGTRSKFNWRSMRSYRSGCSIRGARGIMGCCVKAKISPPCGRWRRFGCRPGTPGKKTTPRIAETGRVSPGSAPRAVKFSNLRSWMRI